MKKKLGFPSMQDFISENITQGDTLMTATDIHLMIKDKLEVSIPPSIISRALSEIGFPLLRKRLNGKQSKYWKVTRL